MLVEKVENEKKKSRKNSSKRIKVLSIDLKNEVEKNKTKKRKVVMHELFKPEENRKVSHCFSFFFLRLLLFYIANCYTRMKYMKEKEKRSRKIFEMHFQSTTKTEDEEQEGKRKKKNEITKSKVMMCVCVCEPFFLFSNVILE